MDQDKALLGWQAIFDYTGWSRGYVDKHRRAMLDAGVIRRRRAPKSIRKMVESHPHLLRLWITKQFEDQAQAKRR